MTRSRVQLGLALAATATLGTLSTGLATAAVAGPPIDHGARGHGAAAHTDRGHHGKPAGSPHASSSSSATHAAQGRGHAGGVKHQDGAAHGHGHGAKADSVGPRQHASAPHNPPGNNGTVKIAGPSDAVGHPSNNPHPGCTFYVEWFGYDQGSDVVSTVSFAPQAPTNDVTIGGVAPTQVFVGGDEAGGGTDLDGRQQYTLSFGGGAPHPKQGYHVKVTVSTPHSLGNDTKTKVFWVEPCTTGSTATPETGPAPVATAEGADTTTSTHASTGASSIVASSPDQAVKGTVAGPSTAGSTAGSTARSSAEAVPTAVDAGEGDQAGALPDWTRSPLPLALLGGGLSLAAIGVVRRKRAGA